MEGAVQEAGAASRRAARKVSEWSKRLLVAVSALLVFETVSGLVIWLAPFSVANQVNVLIHTIAGIVLVFPFFWYGIRHWRMYRSVPLNHVVLTGYFALAATLIAIVSGLVLTYQALFATRIGAAWSLAHLISTFALLAAALPHVVWLLLRDRKAAESGTMTNVVSAENRYLRRMGIQLAGLTLLIPLGALLYQPLPLDNTLPEDYNFLYGDDRPFAPSLARTSTNQAFDARSMGGSASCGRSGCHLEIYEEWQVSAHRWAAVDPAFRAIQTTMGRQNGPESTRYCGGCHDPISLFSGTKNLFQDDLTNPIGLDEGVSCIACHAIVEADVQGNANYVITQPERYLFEMRDGRPAEVVSDFLIRAYPRQHVASLQHRMFKSPEFCASCHKQFIDEEINQVGWVQLQNQYDNWRKSRWNHPGDPTKTIECRECHMPLVDSFDPARGDDLDYNRSKKDGKHRSHRFLGANQFIPSHLQLPGADEQIRLTEAWLRGDFDIPEIEHKWRKGPAVPIEVFAPESVRPGDEVALEVQITNHKVGHDFPTGPLDIIQAWVEIIVTDDAGNEVFSSGKRDDASFIEPGSFMFKAEPVDQYGNLIDRHNLWEMVGIRYRRALFPGFSDKARFTFSCPSLLSSEPSESIEGAHPISFSAPETDGTLHVTARLLYRKIDQYLLNFMFGADSGITSPVSEVSSDRLVIRVERSSTKTRTGTGP